MYYVWILFERYNSLTEILENYELKHIYSIKNDNFIFAGNNTIDIVYSSIGEWNSNLYLRILNYINFNQSKISFKNISNNEINRNIITKKNNLIKNF